jgi:hypothetical protein
VVAGSGAPSRAAVPVEVLVVWSFVYLALRRVLALMVLRWRSAAANEVEVLVPRTIPAACRRRNDRHVGVSGHMDPGIGAVLGAAVGLLGALICTTTWTCLPRSTGEQPTGCKPDARFQPPVIGRRGGGAGPHASLSKRDRIAPQQSMAA